jgi:Bacterial archaeo-eukaryotic release factor family 7
MDRFTRDDMSALLEDRNGPCVSIYTRTRRGGLDKDLLLWQDQLKEAERRLITAGMTADEAAAMTDRARKYLRDDEFWKATSDGLAFFLSKHITRIYRLPVKFANRVFVGSHFHVKPLINWVNADGRFYVLALSQKHVQLCEASAHSIQRIQVAGLPANLADARRTHDRDEPLEFHTHPAGIGRAFEAVFSGHGVGIDDHKDELLHYFQQIDRAIHPILATGKAPLVLATVDYLAPIYRKANKYPHLFEQHLKGNPDRLSDQELHDRIWPLVAPLFQMNANRAILRYRELDGTGRTTKDLSQLLPALHRGEIETLFAADGREAWGEFDAALGSVRELPPAAANTEDLANTAVVEALRHGRAVYVVEPIDLPDGASVAGMYFVPMAKHAK